MKEVWRNIVGYEGLYQVSNWGRVKSLNYHRTGQERILRPVKYKKGYLHLTLWKQGKQKTFQIHRLVAQAFIDNLDNLPCVNHRDENPSNNFVFVREDGSIDFNKSNLEWCTYEYNNNYGTRNERASKTLSQKKTGVYNIKTSKPVAQKTKGGELVKIWPSVQEVQRQTGWSQPNISACCRGERKLAYGYLWQYIIFSCCSNPTNQL